MSLLTDAKLILIPSGYGDGKWYSYKGADFSVTQNTGNATRFNRYGKIETVPANTPRINWVNGKPEILVEPTSTNLIEKSEDYSGSYWNKSNTTITPNDTPSIIKNELADRVVQNTGIIGNINHPLPITANTDVWAVSCYIKKELTDKFAVISARFQTSTFTGGGVQLNKKTGAFTTSVSFLGAYYVNTIDADVISVGDYWYVYFTIQNTDSANTSLRLFFYPNLGTALGSATQVDGDAVIAGIQVEQDKTMPTSLVPTSGGIATRNDEIETVTPPAGTTEIREYLPNGTYNSITTIPATYQIPNGRWQKIIML